MKLKARLRSYRQRNADFDENDRYMISQSGYLFHSDDELNKFTNVDDMFITDNSV